MMQAKRDALEEVDVVGEQEQKIAAYDAYLLELLNGTLVNTTALVNQMTSLLRKCQ